MIVDLVTSLLIYAMLFAAFIGWGRLLSQVLDIQGVSDFMAAWVGFSALLLIFQVVNLFLPLDALVAIPVYLAGVLAFLYFWYSSSRRWRLNCRDCVRIMLILAFSGWVALRAMNDFYVYDTGLYHLNAVKWLNSFAIIPGLGNLHGRLAFNQSIFTYAASLNFSPYFNHAISLVNSSLVILLFAECLWKYTDFLQRQSDNNAWDYLKAMPVLAGIAFVGFLVSQAKQISSMSPDFAVSIMQIVITMYFVDVATDLFAEAEISEKIKVLMLLAVSTVTIKLSAIVYAGAILCSCLFWYGSQHSGLAGRNCPRGVKVFVACSVILLVWLCRGYITSGYPFYPSTVAGIATEWTVPIAQAAKDKFIVTGWARHPAPGFEKAYDDWKWLPYGLDRLVRSHAYSIVVPFFVGTTVLLLAVLRLIRQRHDLGKQGKLMMLLPLPALSGMVFWFFLAPDPRFAQALFWAFSLGSAIMYTLICAADRRRPLSWEVVGLVMFVVTVSFFVETVRCREYLAQISTTGYPANKEVRLVSQQTSSGLVVYTPEEGDQCWDSPLPCTPAFNRGLRLLDGRSIQGGFASTTVQNYGLWWD